MKICCPCGSKQTYSHCCGIYLSGDAIPKTPEALMRSRYTAYTKADIAYIGTTMKGKAALGFNSEAAKAWALRVTWLDLKVIDAPVSLNHQGYVEFIARFIEGGYMQSLHEKSEFLEDNGRWYYIDGEQFNAEGTSQKISRNTACSCNSGKKFKQCHGRAC